jgi:serine/threonine-protein kinase
MIGGRRTPMPQPLAPGTTVGGYRIEDEIGRGGMGIVYVAEQLALGRRVALKVIAPELGDDEDFRARFVREARTAASIDHPGVIPVHDAGEADGVLFLAMRLVPGTDLRTLLASEGEVGPERTIAVLAPVADALDAAHAAGLIHRDVKPANILIERPGTPGQRVYLTDFGLTKRLSSRSRVTRTGFVLGTVDYASPEQLQGREVTAAADVYSLGCVAFECLTGRPPFGGDTDASVIAAHLMEPPPRPSEVVAGLPPAVDSVIAVAMAKDPVARFDSCGALVAALSGALEGVAPREPVARTKALPIAPPPPVPVPARTTGVLPRSPGAPSSGLDQPDGEAAPALLRECPHCREAMRRDARVCPHCRRESTPWTYRTGEWWTTGPDGRTLVLNEETLVWEPRTRPPADGRPRWDVVLLDAGEQRRAVVNAISKETSWHPSGAGYAAKRPPMRVLRTLNQDEARGLADRLRALGARVEVEAVGAAETS